jgi:PAS domain S-box-containing protein
MTDPRRFRDVTIFAAILVVYIAAGKLGLMLAFVHASASPVWPPTGIALAALLIFGYRVWPALFLGAFIVNITTAGSAATSLGIALGNTLEGLLGAYLVNRFANGRNLLNRTADIFSFAALAGLVSTTVSATIGVTSLVSGGFAGWTDYGSIWITWWLGDAAGALIVTPLLLTWHTPPRWRWDRHLWIDTTLLLFATILTGAILFSGLLPFGVNRYPLTFLCIPPLIWAAYQFGPRQAATMVFVLSGLAVWGTLMGFGPFVRESPNVSLILLQAFMATLTMVTLPLAALVADRKRAEDAIREQRERWRVTLMSIGDAVIVTDLRARLTFMNHVAESLTGWREQDAIGRNLVEVFHVVNEATGEPTEDPVTSVIRDGTVAGLANDTVLVARNGARHPIDDSGAPIRDAAGRTLGVVLVFRDVTERKQLEARRAELLARERAARHEAETAERRARFLAEAGMSLATSVEYEATLAQITRLAVPDFADLCAIDLVAPDGSLTRVAATHVDPNKEALVLELRDRYGFDLHASTGVLKVVRTGEADFFPDVTPSTIEAAARHPEHRALLRGVGLRSAIIAPLTARGRTLGALTFATTESDRRYTRADLAFAEELAHRAAFAVDNARLFDVSERHRRSAEALARAARVFSEILDPTAVAQQVMESIRGLFGLRSSIFYVVDPDGAELVAIAVSGDVGPELRPGTRFPLGLATVGRAIRERRVVTTPDALEDPDIQWSEGLRGRVEQAPYRSVLAVPLIFQDSVIGALALGDRAGRVFGADEMRLAQALADHAALALANARLYQEAQQRRQEAEILADLAASINASPDLDTILQRVTEGAKALCESDWAHIGLRDPDSGALVRRYHAGAGAADYSDVGTVPGPGLEERVLVTGRPFRIANSPVDARIEETWASDAGAKPGVAGLAVPIRINSRVEGVLGVASRTRRRFTDRDEAVLLRLVEHAAITIGRARLLVNERAARAAAEMAEAEWTRLLVSEQQARSEAESATRTKDEFLATLSHELRTPLTAILGWTRMLRSGSVEGGTAARALEVIERNARVQSQLVEDLLDVSRIITGKLRLSVRLIDPAEVIRAALESVAAAAEAKGVALETTLSASVGRIHADPDRLQQIVWNLVSNAIKFTPKGGRVDVSLEQEHSRVSITVRDTGRGMSAELLPHVFERFRQADSSTIRQHAGLGLGLAIVRHLVELHGGTVAAHSAGDGQGATFTVTFPVRAASVTDAGAAPPATEWSGPAAAEAGRALAAVRVLVVDDEPDARALLAAIFTAAGATVTTVESADQAVRTLESTAVDVLVSDIGMPGVDGYGLIRTIRSLTTERARQIPAVALTAYARVEDRHRAVAAGYQRHVPKPVEPAELVDIVAKLARTLSPRAHREEGSLGAPPGRLRRGDQLDGR